MSDVVSVMSQRQYDVVVSCPPGIPQDVLREQVLKDGLLDEARLDKLLQHLQGKPAVKIRSAVDEALARQTVANFQRVGFRCDMKVSLQLLDKQESDRHARTECPSCSRLMRPTPEQQCPHCGIRLDNLDRNALAMEKLREQELRKLNARLERESGEASRRLEEEAENRLRAKIRAELEREMGLGNGKLRFFAGTRGAVRLAAISGLLVASFLGGHWLASSARAGAGKLSDQQKALLAQGVLTKVMGGGVLQQGDPALATDFADSPAGQALAQSNDESLMRAVETGQAIPAANLEWQQAVKQLNGLLGQQAATQRQQDRLSLIEMLSELGQIQRAQELLGQLEKSAGYDAVAALPATQRAQAWAQVWSGQPLTSLDPIRASVSGIKDAAGQAQLYAQLAVILSAGSHVGKDSWLGLQSSADAARQRVPAGVARGAIDALLVQAQAACRVNAQRSYAARGLWGEVAQLGGEVDALLHASPLLQHNAPFMLQAAYSSRLRNQTAEADRRLALVNAALSAQAMPSARAATLALLASQSHDALPPLLQAQLGQLAVYGQSLAPAQQASLLIPLGMAEAAQGNEKAVDDYQNRLATLLPGATAMAPAVHQQQLQNSLLLARYFQSQKQYSQADLYLRKAAALAMPAGAA